MLVSVVIMPHAVHVPLSLSPIRMKQFKLDGADSWARDTSDLLMKNQAYYYALEISPPNNHHHYSSDAEPMQTNKIDCQYFRKS